MKRSGIASAAAAALMLLAPQTAQAEVTIYPYASSQNYCPAGLQPVSINGVICCGTPTTHTSYQSAMAHPAPARKHHKTRHVARQSRADCPIGTKGCTFD